MYKDLLSEKRPDLVTKMRERDAQFIRERDADIDRITANRKKEIERQEEREKKEEELDALGRWVYDEGCEDYCWSILDENGQKVLLQDLNQECKGDDDHDPWDDLEIGGYNPGELDEAWIAHFRREKEIEREEINRRQREKRLKLKEELSKPISMPEQGEKGEYEGARDDIIRERHRVMEASGLFNATELQSMLNVII